MRMIEATVTSTTIVGHRVYAILSSVSDNVKVSYGRDDRKYVAQLRKGTKARALATKLMVTVFVIAPAMGFVRLTVSTACIIRF